MLFSLNTKKGLIVLLFGLLAISALGQDPKTSQKSAQPAQESAQENANPDGSDIKPNAHEEWKCNHDHIKHDPQFEKIEEEGLEAAKNGERRLSGHPNLRTYGYYGLMGSGSYKSYAENTLIPPILAYFEAALKVKYPVSGALKINSGSVCGENTPSILRSGVNSDFFYMFKTESASGNWVASSTTCSLAEGSKRPIVAMTTLNTHMMNLPGNNALLHEKNVICIMHEVTHTLGFSSSLFPHFIDANANTLRNIVKDGSLDGMRMQIIDAEPLTSKLQSYFGCSSLRGAYMENNGNDATSGSHFERRQFGMEAMTSGNIYEMKYSQFTLAMLESSGWYVPNYEYADPFFFGQGQGCNFLTGKCSANVFDEFCSSNSRACTVPGGSGGSCQTDSRSDNCKFVHPNIDWHCENSGARSNARLGSAEVYGLGLNSKCFDGTLSEGRQSSSTSFCFQYSCQGSGSNTVLHVEVGRATVACTSRGQKTVSGYSGTINCPDPLTFCSTIGRKSCPRNCMGRGNCVNGGCNCYSGYKGESCSLTA